MKKILSTATLLLFYHVSKAQYIPSFIHNFNNLFLLNPAGAGLNGSPVIYFTYHKQMIGAFENAPEYASIVFNSPIKKSNSSIGLEVHSYKRSFLNTTGATATFAHKIEFDENHNIRIGLSGGFVNNGINLDAADQNLSDPALVSRINNRTIADGQAGFLYQLANLQLGISLPKLFRFYGLDNSNTLKGTLSPFRNYIITGLYQINISQNVIIQPMINYRVAEYTTSGFEFNGTVIYKNQAWLATTYKQEYGTSFMVGVKAKNRISVSYAYKLPDSQLSGFANPAHEIQLGFHFGKKAIQKPNTLPALVTPINDKLKSTVLADVKTNEELKIKPELKKDLMPKETHIKKDIEFLQKGNHPKELAISYYVVVGAFLIEKNAQSYIHQLKEQNIIAKTGYNSQKNRYYVYILTTSEREKATEELEKMRNMSGFEESWILKISK